MSESVAECTSINFGGRRYDRTQALIDGRVKPEGLDWTFHIEQEVDLLIRNMLFEKQFDSSEFSLSSYISFRARGENSLVAIPVFPSRCFRHSYIVVNKNAGIREPRDLIGKKVGIMQWEQTALVWMRGLLQHEYDVPLEKLHWITFRRDISSHKLEKYFDIKPSSQLDTETSVDRAGDALERGDIDAVMAAQLPKVLRTGRNVKRLFTDWYNTELDYYARTKIFPIMHTVVLTSRLNQEHPGAARSIHQAFSEAKEAAYEYLAGIGLGAGDIVSSAGVRKAYEDSLSILGPDPYPYNIKDNRKAIETLIQYQLDQRITEREMKIDDLFAHVE